MRKPRWRGAKRLINKDLLMRIRQVVLPSNYICDFHLNVVEHDGQIVEWVTVRAEQDKIFDL